MTGGWAVPPHHSIDSPERGVNVGHDGHSPSWFRAPGGVSLLQLPLALVNILPLPGPEFKRGQWSFRMLGLGLIGRQLWVSMGCMTNQPAHQPGSQPGSQPGNLQLGCPLLFDACCNFCRRTRMFSTPEHAHGSLELLMEKSGGMWGCTWQVNENLVGKRGPMSAPRVVTAGQGVPHMHLPQLSQDSPAAARLPSGVGVASWVHPVISIRKDPKGSVDTVVVYPLSEAKLSVGKPSQKLRA